MSQWFTTLVLLEDDLGLFPAPTWWFTIVLTLGTGNLVPSDRHRIKHSCGANTDIKVQHLHK